MLGVFDLNDARNPFRDWSMVVIPSCTGDVFIGSTDHTYRQGREHIVIRHRGWFNGEASLRWAFRHFPAPERVFVAGSSAGSVGSAFHAPEVIEHYGGSRVSQLGDSLAFASPHPLSLTKYHGLEHLPSWLQGDRQLRPGRFTMTRFLARLIAHYPRTTFARFNFRADEVQTRFYAASGGRPSDFPRALVAAERKLHAEAPRYRSFLACGRGHTILPLWRFRSLSVGGVALRDWTARIAEGQPVRSHACPPPPQRGLGLPGWRADPLLERGALPVAVVGPARWLAPAPGQAPLTQFDVQLVRLDGSGRKTLTTSPDRELDAQWSPAGDRLSYSRLAKADEEDWRKTWIWTMRPDGNDQRPLVRGSYARWSPDGKRLVFTAPTPRSDGDLFVINADGSGLRRLLATRAWKCRTHGRPADGRSTSRASSPRAGQTSTPGAPTARACAGSRAREART